MCCSADAEIFIIDKENFINALSDLKEVEENEKSRTEWES